MRGVAPSYRPRGCSPSCWSWDASGPDAVLVDTAVRLEASTGRVDDSLHGPSLQTHPEHAAWPLRPFASQPRTGDNRHGLHSERGWRQRWWQAVDNQAFARDLGSHWKAPRGPSSPGPCPGCPVHPKEAPSQLLLYSIHHNDRPAQPLLEQTATLRPSNMIKG